MSETEEKPFAVERAKTGRAKCKSCKLVIEKDEVRIAKLVANPFAEGKMKAWYHLTCIFEVFARQKATSKKLDDPHTDIEGWDLLSPDDKQLILDKLQEFEDAEPYKAKNETFAKVAKKTKPEDCSSGSSKEKKKAEKLEKSWKKESNNCASKDDMFREFRRLCASLSNTSAYTAKTALIKQLFEKGSNGDTFKSNILLWCSLLLPQVVGRVYNLQSKQLIKLFSRILLQDETEMLEHLEQGDVAETIRIFFESSSSVRPNIDSVLTIQEVDSFLHKLSQMTTEVEQIQHFKSIIRRCTSNDLKIIIRLIKHDLRINAGPKHVLGAVHDEAYAAFQASRDLASVIERFVGENKSVSLMSLGESKVGLTLMTPVLPMLAEACKSVEMAMQKCPHGMLSEVKYDGERVQVHKQGSQFKYYSRSLKPVLQHKVKFLQDCIPMAFPTAVDLILDSEILLIDTNNGAPLPFGSLGKHKKEQFKDANVCLFVFDCIYFNGQSLMNKSIKERRKILEENMKPIKNRILLSQVQIINKPQDLAQMIVKVLKLGLEGLVLKDINSKYEPGKRHWLKVKKDYLCGGAMADSADLVVLGAWYGTGANGGKKSIFLMGCYDTDRDIWLTVTKVHGFEDETLADLQERMKDMVKIGKDPKLVPKWLKVNKAMVPDFIVKDPKEQQVWEIAGAEFTNQGVHTADGISIRFPRVVKFRNDKNWQTATNLNELRTLFKRSSEDIDFSLFVGPTVSTSSDTSESPPKKKRNPDDSPNIIPKKRMKTEESPRDVGFEKPKKKLLEEKSKLKSEEKANDKLLQVKLGDKSGAKEGRAEYYYFLGTDYIEYTANGSPLNWIKDRKPPQGLPKQAKRLDERSDDEMARCVLNDACVKVQNDFRKDQRKQLVRNLKTLGAVLVDDELQKVTHVVHGKSRLPATILDEFEGIPKTAVHVTESWVEEAIARQRQPQSEPYAVTLFGVSCTCPCSHVR